MIFAPVTIECIGVYKTQFKSSTVSIRLNCAIIHGINDKKNIQLSCNGQLIRTLSLCLHSKKTLEYYEHSFFSTSSSFSLSFNRVIKNVFILSAITYYDFFCKHSTRNISPSVLFLFSNLNSVFFPNSTHFIRSKSNHNSDSPRKERIYRENSLHGNSIDWINK